MLLEQSVNLQDCFQHATNKVKLKWLQSISSPFNETASSTNKQTKNKHSTIGNGHEFDIIKAGQSAAFECNAAGQPRPRVRWFRLAAPDGATAVGSHSKHLPTSPHKELRLDEAQIRSTLIQWDNLADSSFQRYELISLPSEFLTQTSCC